MTIAIACAIAAFPLGLLLALTAHWKLRATATEWLASMRDYFVPPLPAAGETSVPIERTSAEDTAELVRWTRELGRQDPDWLPALVELSRQKPLPTRAEPAPSRINTVPVLRAAGEIVSLVPQVTRTRLLWVGVLAALCGWLLGQADYAPSQAVVVAAVVYFMGVAALVDLDSKYLPDDLTLPLLWAGLVVNCGLVSALVSPLALVAPPGLMVGLPPRPLTSADTLLGAAFGYLCLWLLNWAYKILTLRDGMGYGDFKLLAAIGAWVGIGNLLQVVVVAAFAGSAVGIILMVRHGRDSKYAIAFGPFLAGSAILFMCSRTYLPLFAGLLDASHWPLIATPLR